VSSATWTLAKDPLDPAHCKVGFFQQNIALQQNE